jgi:hypothetical protein
LGATVSGKPYEMTAETIDPCQVTFVKRDDFPEFLKDDVEACFKVAEQLSEKYYDACKEVRSLELSQSAVEKLAKLLLEWSWPRRLDSFVRGGRGAFAPSPPSNRHPYKAYPRDDASHPAILLQPRHQPESRNKISRSTGRNSTCFLTRRRSGRLLITACT